MTMIAMPTLPLRGQATLRNAWLRDRLDQLLPELMARANLDSWIVIAREYNEDPVIMTLLPEPEMAARRRTILLFTRRADGSVERLAIGRYPYPGLEEGAEPLYQAAWNPDQEEQDVCLRRLVTARNPRRIGINVSPTFAFADGLTHHEHERLIRALGPELSVRLVSAEAVAVGWLERRSTAELAFYPRLVAMGHQLIAHAFSAAVIRPGETTTDDLVWWLRQAMHDLGLQAWFQPDIMIQAPDQSYTSSTPRRCIQPGDLLWVDVGFSYLGLHTDHQQHAYLLRPGETDAPAGLRAALAAGNRLQDLLMEELQVGRSGNEILRRTRARALADGLVPSVYTHPLGYHGHAAGPTIGLWDRQEGVPGMGDYPVFNDTVYAIELNVRCPVAEWGGQEVRIAVEEDACVRGGSAHWLHGRQERLHLI